MYEGSDTTDDDAPSAAAQNGTKNETFIVLSSDDEDERIEIQRKDLKYAVHTLKDSSDVPRLGIKRRASNHDSDKNEIKALKKSKGQHDGHDIRRSVEMKLDDTESNDNCLVGAMPFPKGAIRHSEVSDRHSPMSISKVDLFLKNRPVKRALLLCFLVEFDFLTTLFDEAVPLDIVTESNNILVHPQHKNWNIQARLSQSFQCIHSKVFFIQCEGFMRLIVSTANLIAIDFDNLDNVFYIHDFPTSKSPVTPSIFQEEVLMLLSDHQVDFPVSDIIQKTDFSSSQVSLITSKPGTYYGDLSNHAYGQLSLARKIAESGILVDDHDIADHCTSSIGNLNVPWIQTFRDTLSGRKNTISVDKNNTRLIYPTFKDVERSTKHGEEQRALADNIVCNGRSSDAAWPRDLFWGYSSARYGTLYHAKTTLVYTDGNKDDSCAAETAAQAVTRPKFLVLGSHNFSQAAWGSVVVQGPRARYKGLKTVIGNYEVSVFVPGHLLTDAHLLPKGVDWQRGVTYQLDGLQRYEVDDRPWTVRFWT